MSLILSGTDGLSDIDGSAATPAIRGTDANTGIFFGADIIGFAEGGAEVARFNADAQFVAAAGTALLPVITTTGDVNTGIFFPAADTIAFSEGGAEAMRIDSDGDVGIGTASPAAKLNVIGNTSLGAAYAPATPSSAISFQTIINSGGVLGSHPTYTSAANTGGVLLNAYDFNNGSNYDMVANIIAMPQTWTGNGNGSLLRFLTASSSSSSPTEAMRIDPSGNLLVGTTSATSKITFKQGGDNASGGMAFVRGDNSNYFYLLTGADNNFYFGYNGSARGVINGSTGVYTALSDARLKENVTPIAHGLNAILSLNPVSYTMVGDETAVQQIGLIAQEVEPVVPEVISAPTVSNSWYGLNYAGFVPVLIKAIQEQQALITALTARITALETQNADNPPQGETP